MRLPMLALALALTSPAFAQDAPPPRFAFVPASDGMLRLDTETGEVSLCRDSGGSRSCSVVPDEIRGRDEAAAALEDRIARLEAKIAALEARQPADVGALPDEEAMDRVMVLADRMMRRFFGLVRDLENDMDGERL